MKAGLAIRLATFVLAASVMPSYGHHSTAEYDTSKVVTIKGTVSRLDWRNPHVRIHVDVTGVDHHIANWDVETWGIGQLSVRGLTNGFLRPGDHVGMEVFPAKDRTLRAIVHMLTLPDGSAVDGPPVDFPNTR